MSVAKRTLFATVPAVAGGAAISLIDAKLLANQSQAVRTVGKIVAALAMVQWACSACPIGDPRLNRNAPGKKVSQRHVERKGRSATTEDALGGCRVGTQRPVWYQLTCHAATSLCELQPGCLCPLREITWLQMMRSSGP